MATTKMASVSRRRVRGMQRVVDHVRTKRRAAMERRVRALRKRVTAGTRKGWRAEDLVRAVRTEV